MLLEINQKYLEKRHMLLLTSLILLKIILKIKKDVYVSVKKLYDDIKKELNLLNDKTYNISNDLCDLKNYIIKFKKESYINKIKIKVVKNKISDINVILHDAKRQFNWVITKVRPIKNNENNKNNNKKSELDILREEAHALGNTSKALRKESDTIRNTSKVLREEINILKNDLKMQCKAIISKNKIYNNTDTKIIKLQRD